MTAMRQLQRRRTRHDIEHELFDTIERRNHAARALDIDAYQNLVAQIDDLLDELTHEMRGSATS